MGLTVLPPVELVVTVPMDVVGVVVEVVLPLEQVVVVVMD